MVCSTCADVTVMGARESRLHLRRHQLPDRSVAGASYVISVAAVNLIAGQSNHFKAFDLVLSHASTFGVTKTDAIHCTCRFELGSSERKLKRDHAIGRYFRPSVRSREGIGGFRVPPIGGTTKPEQGHAAVCLHAQAVAIHFAELELGFGPSCSASLNDRGR